MAEQIDAYAHIMPREFLEAMVDTRSDREVDTLENAPHLWDIQQRIDVLDEYGIDRQVITLARPPIWRGMDPESALPLVRKANEAVRRIADEHPDRFIPVGTVPFGGDQYREEFERCVNEREMAGVQIYSNTNGRPIDDGSYEPIFEAANELEVPLWLHPQLHDWYSWIDENMDHKMLGWPFDTTVALSRLIFSGVFDRYPDLNVIAHHSGGMLPFFGARIKSFYKTRRQYPEVYPGIDMSHLSRSIDAYYEQIYADTAIGGSAAALRCALEFFGPENLMFGVDYPFGPDEGRQWLAETNLALERMELESSVRSKIESENIRGLLDL